MNLALALLTGVLLVLIHPRFDLWFLSPVALTPLLIALAREWRPKHRFLLGYAAGLASWGGMCYWIHFVMDVHGRMGPWLAAGVFVLFCLLKAVNLGLFGLFGGILIHSRYAVFSIPALWVILERIPDPFGFMWLHLGNAAVNLALPMRAAPLVGVYGISFLLAVLGTGVALVTLRRPRLELTGVLVVFTTLLMRSLPPEQPKTEAAIAVQPNIPETDVWTVDMVASLNNALERLSLRPASGITPRLILWPEVPAPIYYYDDPFLRNRVAAIAAATQSYVLIGTVAYNEHKAPLNAALMVGPDGQALGRYDKMFLVPFGEYVPFPFGTIAGKVTNEIGDFVPGEHIVTFRTRDEMVGAFICYESAFPHLVRRFVAEGATVLANLSNDGYFGETAAREQHLSLVRMRAAENRRWILRATNNGITAAVDPAGRVTTTLPEFVQTSGRLPFGYIRDLTPYTKFGDWFAWLCGLAALLALIASQRPHYMPEDSPQMEAWRRKHRAKAR